jgi:hypothetical protein
MLLDFLSQVQHCGSVNVKPPHVVAALEMLAVGRPTIYTGRADTVTYNAYCGSMLVP